MRVSRLIQVILLVVGTLAEPGRAERIKLKSGLTVTGTIEQYDERGVTLRLSSKQVVLYPARSVEHVEVEWNSFHKSADESLSAGDFEQAIEEYRAALNDESRNWAKQRIRVGLIRACVGAKRIALAAEEFVRLAGERADPELMALAPLVWVPNQKLPDEAVARAKQWIGDERPMARLLAASCLLESDQARAVGVLRELAAKGEQRIAWMARSQLWRALSGKSKEEIEEFQRQIEAMPESIRGGPKFVLGLAHEAADAPRDAAFAFLWLPFVYNEDTELATESLLRAAQATEKAGLNTDARKLYQELVDKHGSTEQADRAARRLQELPKAK